MKALWSKLIQRRLTADSLAERDVAEDDRAKTLAGLIWRAKRRFQVL